MTLNEIRQQLSAYLDGELAEAPRREVEAALAARPELRAELAELRRVAQLVGSLPREAAPAGFSQRVEAALTGTSRHPAPPSLLRRLRPALLAAAACLAVAAASIWINQSRGPRPGAHHLTSESLAKPDTPAPEGAKALHEGAADRMAEEADEKADATKRYADTAPTAPKPSAAAKDLEHGVTSGGGASPREPAVAKASPAPMEPKSAPRAVAGTDGSHFEMAKKAPAQPAIVGGTLHDSVAQTAAGQFSLESREQAVRRKSQAGEADALVAAIERPAAKQGGRHALSVTVGADAPTRAAEDRSHSVRLAYADLHRCLADVRRALDWANVPYVIQPVGSGEFRVTVTLPAQEAPALLGRLAGGAARGGEAHATLTGRANVKSEAATPAGNGLSSVSLVLHFLRAEAQGGGAPAAHPQQ